MKCVYLLFVVISWSTSTAEDICIRGHLHQRTWFKAQGMRGDDSMAMDSQNGLLYYIYSHRNISQHYVHRLTMPDVQRDWSFSIYLQIPMLISVDEYTGDLYMIANNDTSRIALDLFKYHRKSKEVTKIAEKIHTSYDQANKLYAYKNQAFWIDRYRRMFRYNKGRVGMHNIKMTAYAEDLDGSIYFIKEKDKHNVYKVRKGEKTQLRFVTTDVVTDLIRDAQGKVYAGSTETIKLYEISEEEGRLVPASDKLPKPSASYRFNFQFDQSNDIIWLGDNNQDRIEKFVQTLKPCEYKN